MKHNYFIYLIVLIVFSISSVTAQSIDSLLNYRKVNLNDYTIFKSDMSERSWINLVNLSTKADEIISVDSEIIDKYFQNEMYYNRQLNASLESAKLNLSLYKKEAEVSEAKLKEQKAIVNILMIVVAAIGILLIVAIIFLVGSHARNKEARKEIERLWRKQDEPKPKQEISLDKNSLTKKIAKLSEENDLLKKRLESIDKLKLNAEEKLKEEISSRRETEKEIRSLIDQIKK